MTKPSDPPDFATLARQYLDLWEDQLAAMAADPDLAGQTARLVEAMAQFGAAASPLATANLAALMGWKSPAGPAARDDEVRQAGPAAAAAAPGDGDRRLDELARRLGDVEERLARLEAGGGAQGGGARGGAGKRAGGGRPKGGSGADGRSGAGKRKPG